MTYEELLISIDLNGYENVLSSVGKKYLDSKCWHWFVVCDDGDCHLFDENGGEEDISKFKEINEDMIPKDIKKIVIPDSVISIKDYAFDSCNELTSVIIPDSVTSIGCTAFSWCSRLTSVIISNSVTTISEYMFSICGLTSITIPNSVTSIGDNAFSYCDSLVSVTIPDCVTNIGNFVFYDCNGLTSITIPTSVMSIGKLAFKHCTNLNSLIFKGKSLDQIRSMKNYPFGIVDESIIKCN